MNKTDEITIVVCPSEFNASNAQIVARYNGTWIEHYLSEKNYEYRTEEMYDSYLEIYPECKIKIVSHMPIERNKNE
jgi:hypothetical protein